MGKKSFDSINWDTEFPEVPQCFHDAVTEANNIVLAKNIRRSRRMSGKGMLLLAAALTLLSGMTVFAATGLWQQRMEAMNQQEVEEYFLSIATSSAPAFRYNRSMTEEERALYEEMTILYESEGIFPEGVLTMLSDVSEYKGKGIGYEPVSGTFFLPKGELDEEMLLQIIDFTHKVDYSLQKVNEQVESGEISLPKESVEEPVEEPVQEFRIMEEFEVLNEQVSYLQIDLAGVDLPQDIAVGNEYLYLGFKNEIKRVVMGTDNVETFYQLEENCSLLAMDADKENNMYLSLRRYEEATDSYTHRLVKVNGDGELVTEYDVKSAKFSEERTLSDTLSYKMLAGEDGNLYVKARWGSDVLLYVFGEDGTYLDVIYDGQQRTHPAGSICFGKDGYLYILGEEDIIKVDTSTRKVIETFPYETEDMMAAVDLLHPMEEDSFYMYSYDGVFTTTLGSGTSSRVLAPYESEVFGEGSRRYPVSEDTLVVVNHKEWGITITYLSIK